MTNNFTAGSLFEKSVYRNPYKIPLQFLQIVVHFTVNQKTFLSKKEVKPGQLLSPYYILFLCRSGINVRFNPCCSICNVDIDTVLVGKKSDPQQT